MITICISLSFTHFKPKPRWLAPSLSTKISLRKFNNNLMLLNPLDIFPVLFLLYFSVTCDICSTPSILKYPHLLPSMTLPSGAQSLLHYLLLRYLKGTSTKHDQNRPQGLTSLCSLTQWCPPHPSSCISLKSRGSLSPPHIQPVTQSHWVFCILTVSQMDLLLSKSTTTYLSFVVHCNSF